VFGRPAVEALARLGHGIAIDDVKYGPIKASIDTQKGDNCWLIITLREGKNREVRRVLEHLGHQVSRLIRIAYGPFQLGHLDPGEVREVPPKVLREQLGLTSPGTARKQVRANRRR
jgi:23S rRNA pseudouridine2605 synthase